MTIEERSPEAADITVVVITSDLCPSTRAAVPGWLDLVETLGRSHGVALEVVSLSGDDVPSLLFNHALRRDVTYRGRSVTRRTAFIFRTGITSTPALLLLDSARRVRLVGRHFDRSFAEALSLAAPRSFATYSQGG